MPSIGNVSSALSAAVLLLSYLGFALAECECGYSATVADTTGAQVVFTDLLETDFTQVLNLTQNTDWKKQQFNVSSTQGRGTYGKMFLPSNVITQSSTTDGLQLLVGNRVVDSMVSGSELDSARMDLFYGSYRTSLKLSDIPGTCAAFFWVSTQL
jgi:hypothetical protein